MSVDLYDTLRRESAKDGRLKFITGGETVSDLKPRSKIKQIPGTSRSKRYVSDGSSTTEEHSKASNSDSVYSTLQFKSQLNSKLTDSAIIKTVLPKKKSSAKSINLASKENFNNSSNAARNEKNAVRIQQVNKTKKHRPEENKRDFKMATSSAQKLRLPQPGVYTDRKLQQISNQRVRENKNDVVTAQGRRAEKTRADETNSKHRRSSSSVNSILKREAALKNERKLQDIDKGRSTQIHHETPTKKTSASQHRGLTSSSRDTTRMVQSLHKFNLGDEAKRLNYAIRRRYTLEDDCIRISQNDGIILVEGDHDETSKREHTSIGGLKVLGVPKKFICYDEYDSDILTKHHGLLREFEKKKMAAQVKYLEKQAAEMAWDNSKVNRLFRNPIR